MIILEKPYLSDLLLDTVRDLEIEVLRNETARSSGLDERYLLDEETFIQRLKTEPKSPLYTNSEDSIPWIQANLAWSDLPDRIEIFKNKARFRKLLQPLYPDYWYKEADVGELAQLNIAQFPKPFILKPATGFLSLGVSKVNNSLEWEASLSLINELRSKTQSQYPVEVVNFQTFILEEYVEGEEYAIDVYYNSSGHPVILNILKHEFASETDVRDRLYLTSKDIIDANLKRFQDFLNQIGDLVSLINLPLHVEVRVSKAGEIFPIEFNPMRFAGWCTTDIAYYAYGINVYEYFWRQKEPDWKKCLKGKENKVFSIVVGDIPPYQGQVTQVDYQSFADSFAKPLVIRKIDYSKYGLFAFAFTEIEGTDQSEFDQIQRTDYREFITFGEK
ncbi:MAG: ATP-grasp domain-containing protein [Desulfitobacteriaceae bacterium]